MLYVPDGMVGRMVRFRAMFYGTDSAPSLLHPPDQTR